MRNFVFILVLLITSCTKVTEIVPEFESSTLVGYVNCYDEYGNVVANSGVTVKLENDSIYSTTSNEDGYFKLTVPIGVQDFIFEKEGFGAHKYSLMLVGGSKPVYYYGAELYKYIDVELLDFSYSYDDEGEVGRLRLEGYTKSETPKCTIYYGFSTKAEEGYHIWGFETISEDGYFFESIWMEGNGLIGYDELYIRFWARNYYDNNNRSTHQDISGYEKLEIDY